MNNLPTLNPTIPCFFDSHWRNPNVGVCGPDPIIAHHLLCGSTYNGNTELPVCMTLYSLALANHAKAIVETGINNAAGATLWLALAAYSSWGHYYGVDTRAESCETAQRVIGEILPGVSANIQCGDALKLLPREFAPGTIDFLFVDDNHERAHVEAEIATFRPLMRAGGLMCFHDVLGVHAHDIWDAISPLGAIKLIDSFHRPDHPFGGLGILKV